MSRAPALPAPLHALCAAGPDALPAEAEALVRRAARHYTEARLAIRSELDQWAPDAQAICARAIQAAEWSPQLDGPRLDSEHHSVRMCQWICADRYRALHRIAASGPDDCLQRARTQIGRALAKGATRARAD